MLEKKTWVVLALLALCLPGLALAGGAQGKAKKAQAKAQKAPVPALIKLGPAWAIHGGHIVHLSQEGRVHAWRAQGLEPDPEYTQALASQKLRLIATGGGGLWGTDLARVYRWSDEARAWKSEFELPKTEGSTIDLVIVGDEPVVVYPTRVVSARTGKVYPLSDLKDAAYPFFRALTVRATKTHVWVGTGYGEWGGALFGLELASGKWVQFKDTLHYVTGISEDGQGRLWVSWSMSHFGADTLLRLHRPDATVERAFPELRSSYLQTVAWDEVSQTLHGLEQNRVVRLEDGKPVELLSLGELPYSAEPNAIGAAPGFTGMGVLGPGRFLLIHERLDPRVYAEGKAVLLPLW